MANLILFSENHHHTIDATFAKASVRHYQPGYFELGQDHDFDFTYDGERKLINELNILIQFAENRQCQHIYIINTWNVNNTLLIRMHEPNSVMIELSDGNIKKINEVAVQNMFYEDINASLHTSKFPDKLINANNKFSAMAADVNGVVDQLLIINMEIMKEMLIQDIRNLYI